MESKETKKSNTVKDYIEINIPKDQAPFLLELLNLASKSVGTSDVNLQTIAVNYTIEIYNKLNK